MQRKFFLPATCNPGISDEELLFRSAFDNCFLPGVKKHAENGGICYLYLWGFITTQLTLSGADSFSAKPVAEEGCSRNSRGLQAFANL